MIGFTSDLDGKTVSELEEILERAKPVDGDSQAAAMLKKGIARQIKSRIDDLKALVE